MEDLILTWPKERPLTSYIDELTRAERLGQYINFYVKDPPRGVINGNTVGVDFRASSRKPKAYMVHTGYIRGHNEILGVVWRTGNEVSKIGGGFWKAGWYIVRDPAWYPLEELIEMRGFQGFRYVPEDLKAKL